MRLLLPRELRDAVYEHLLADCEQPVADVRAMEQTGLEEQLLPTNWRRTFTSCGMSHILDREFMGQDTLRELAETYYRCSTFAFDCDSMKTADISRVLFTFPDRWDCDVDHANTVRNLEFRACDWDMYCLGPHYDMREQLKLLMRLKQPAKIAISLHRTRYAAGRTTGALSQAASVNFLMFDRLMCAGHDLRLKINGKEVLKMKREDLSVEIWAKIVEDPMLRWNSGA